MHLPEGKRRICFAVSIGPSIEPEIDVERARRIGIPRISVFFIQKMYNFFKNFYISRFFYIDSKYFRWIFLKIRENERKFSF